MKKLCFFILLSVVLFSCSKEDVITPKQETTTVPAVTQPTAFYKDDFISITDVKATQTASGQVTFNFSTAFEKNLKSVEVYSGASNALLCEIFSEARNGSSQQIKKYSLVEKNIQTSVNYYMIKYTTINNEWSVSPLFKVELK